MAMVLPQVLCVNQHMHVQIFLDKPYGSHNQGNASSRCLTDAGLGARFDAKLSSQANVEVSALNLMMVSGSVLNRLLNLRFSSCKVECVDGIWWKQR